jgi:chromosome segregation ATPase
MTESDPFVKKVTTEMRDMEKLEQKLRRDAESIRERLAQMRQRRTELERSLAVYREMMGGGQEVSTVIEATGTIAEVALRILRESGEPKTINDLVVELKSLGKLKGGGGASGRADYATVYQALRRDDRFVKGDNGEFSPAPEVPSAPERPS